jgi:hypothetical protein
LQNKIKIGQIKGNPKKKENIQQNKATQTLEISRKQTYGINVMDASHKVQAKRIFSSKEIQRNILKETPYDLKGAFHPKK